MASPMPRGPPRPHGFNQKNPPPPDYNLNALADNVQNLNINRPISTPNSGPRTAPPFGQSLPFPPTAPAPFASPSMSRPGSPPGALARLSMPSSAPTPPTLPSNVSPGRSITPAVSVPILAPGSRPPPPGSLPSSLGGPVVPPPGAPSGGFPFSGLSGGPTVAPPPGPRPFTSSASLPLAAAGPSVAPPNSCASDPMNNGQRLASGTFTSRPTFPAPGSTTMSVMGLPPTRAVVRAPSQAPSTLAFPGSSAVDAPLAPPMQSPSPFADGSLDVSASLDPPPATQIWMGQPHQMPGSVQPPRMFGTTPSLPSQPMTTISPAMGQSGSFVAAPSKIDPDHIPRPTQSSTMTVHETLQGSQANPSLAVASDYVVRDTGNCSPQYMRCTINQIPCTVDLLNTSGMQLALLVQPLALPHPSEEPIQVVDFGESGPVRCSRCKGYINPFMKFIDQGRRFICNLCGNTEVTPHDYHCNLAPDGRHRDADERPELCRGTVEFVASTEYMVREPMRAVYFFLIDVSMNAMQTGAGAAACSAISHVLSDLPEGPRTMVGIATFDSTIHFYNLKRALQQPLMLIVPDVEDVYTPLQSDVIVQLSECRQHLELLLENIPSMFQNNKTSDSAFGAAVQASFLAMKSNGGKLLVFQSVLPSLGIGSLSSREAEGRINISAGEKENDKLLQPADSTLKTMAMDFAEYQVCIDVFITTQTFVDITSISVISRTTGGQVYYYFPFSALADPSKLYNDLRWNVTRPQGFEAVMRVRCSQGIQVQEYSGNFCKRIPTDIDLPGIDSDKTIMVTLKHDDKLQDGSECAFQCALLYTTLYGQRRIRVMTLSLPCTNMLSNLFHTADLDTQFTCFLKQVACRIPSIPLAIVREQVLDQCVSILFSYRKFCATASSSGQLILPEALKLLPLYTLALMKSAGMRTDGRIDDRSFWINYVSFLSPSLAIPLVYPRMMAIHDLPKGKEEPLVPNSMPLSSEQLSDEGIYFLENGEDALIYVGDLVDSDIMEQLFGISSLDGISTQFVLQQFENPLSKNLNDVVNEIRHQRCSYLRIKLCKKGDPSGMLFLSYMVEDRNAGSPSYIEFLVQVHQQILIKMS